MNNPYKLLGVNPTWLGDGVADNVAAPTEVSDSSVKPFDEIDEDIIRCVREYINAKKWKKDGIKCTVTLTGKKSDIAALAKGGGPNALLEMILTQTLKGVDYLHAKHAAKPLTMDVKTTPAGFELWLSGFDRNEIERIITEKEKDAVIPKEKAGTPAAQIIV